MRMDAQRWMSSFSSTTPPTVDEINAVLSDFGFYHPLREVKLMYAEYVNNNLLGYSGGVLEQPDEYWADINTMRWLRLWVEHVQNAPRMQQVSVFDTLKTEGRINGKWMKNG